MDLRQAEAPRKAPHDSDVPENLLQFMRESWLDTPLRTGSLDRRQRFVDRRAELSRAFPGETLIVPAGTQRVRANDTHYPFRTGSDFAYLVGAPAEPGSALIMEPADGSHRSLLFVPAHNRGGTDFFTDRAEGELWVGRHRGVDESQLFFGVDACRPLSQLTAHLDDLKERPQVRVLHDLDERIDQRFARRDADNALATHLSEMRLIKDEDELAQLRFCIAITKRGFEDAIRILPKARSEREIEAAFWSRARIDANDVGYGTIAAAGPHSCTLHWTRNDGAVRPGELLLMDAGVEAESLYTADITRTLPISGTFSKEQRAVYDVVYAAQRAAFEHVRPGNEFLEPNRAAMRVVAEGLRDLGVLRMSLDEAIDPQNQYYRRYTLHNVSHMLGIDVHDCAKARAQAYRYGKLQAGMVLTVEPGLYFQPDDASVPEPLRGIGVRIEDDAAVTGTGCENLSAAIPSEASAVEEWMAAHAPDLRSHTAR